MLQPSPSMCAAQHWTLSAPRPGELGIPGYRLGRALGTGGMGTVYEAARLDDEALVAIKVVSAVDDEKLIQRFHQEIEIGKQLDHPDLVRVFDSGDGDGVAWMVMERLEGLDLSRVITDRTFGFDDRLRVLIRAARALAHANEAGIIHRDVKPANIFLTNDGGVRVLDFGISKIGNRRLTTTGEVAGTPHFVAPEQVFGGEVDARIDVFALGVVAYVLFTGDFPWRQTNTQALLWAVCSRPPEPFEASVYQKGWFDLHPRVVSELGKVVTRALDADKARRTPDMRTFASELETVLSRTFAEDKDADRVDPSPTQEMWIQRELEGTAERAAAHAARRRSPKHSDGESSMVWRVLVVAFTLLLVGAVAAVLLQ